MKKVLFVLLYLVFITILKSQPASFSFTTSNVSALFLGQAEINNIPATEGDWIAVFDTDNVCVGAVAIIVSNNKGFFTLPLYGDDPSTTDIDEGLQEGESFTIKIWDNAFSNIIPYPDINNPTVFTGWTANNGAPLDDFSDINAVFNFTNPYNIPCTTLSSPADGAINKETAIILSWFEVSNTTGYKISVGDQSGNYNLLDTFDIGNTLSYLLDSLDCATTYYVKIIPYNETFNQYNCIESSFSTIFNTAEAGNDVSICQLSSITLQASGGSSYYWSPSTGLSDTTTSNPVASPDVTTLYTVEAHHPNGCVDTDAVLVTVLGKPQINLTINNETSEGANNGSAFSNPSGGEEPYTFLWSNGSTGSSIVDLQPGAYGVTVTSSNQCVSEKDFVILGYDCQNFIVSTDIYAVSCHNDCDGKITVLSVENGVGPYSYYWNTGDTTNALLNKCSGLYSLTITDDINCSTIKTYILENPGVLDANMTNVAESSQDGHDGIAYSAPLGGTEPYNYLWNNDSTIQYIDSLKPDIYWLTVTDSRSCSTVSPAIIKQFGCESLSLISNVTDMSCNGMCDGRVTLDLVTGGVGPFSYSWSTGGTDTIIDDLCLGFYSLTVTDSDSCHAFAVFEIKEPAALISYLNIVNESRENADNGKASISLEGGTAPYFYQWSNGNNTDHIDGLSPGDYEVTVIDSKNCSSIETFTIVTFICPTLVVQKTFDNISCKGACDASINIGISGGLNPYSFEWNTGENVFSLNSLCPDTFIVIVTDSSGCQVIDTTIVDQVDSLTMSLEISPESGNITHDGVIMPVVTGGELPYQYNWSNGESSSLLNNLVPGSYDLTLTDARNCQIIQENIIILPFVCEDLEIDHFLEHIDCHNQCDGSINITNIKNGTFPFEYEWDSGETTNSILNKCGGEYKLTITDTNDCTLEKTFTVVEPDPFFIDFDFRHEVKGKNNGYIHASVLGGTDPYQFNWNTGSTDLNLDNIIAGNYTLTVTDANECLVEKSVNITTIDCDLLSLTSTSGSNSCNGSIDSYITIEVNNPNEPYTIKWSNDFEGTAQTQLSKGTYTVTVTDDYGCTVVEQFVINTPEPLIITLDEVSHSTDSDIYGAVKSTITGGTEPYQYTWTSNNGYASNSLIIDSLVVDCYHLEVIDAMNCSIDYDICVADLTTAIVEYNNIDNILIYPNPTSEIIHITIEALNSIGFKGKILDFSGKQLDYFKSKTSSTKIDVSQKASGIYFLELEINGKIIYKKIYIQK